MKNRLLALKVHNAMQRAEFNRLIKEYEEQQIKARGSGISFWSACDWIECQDGKQRPVESGTQPLAHGVSDRVGLLRGYGNAIVPQVAAAFIEAYLSI